MSYPFIASRWFTRGPRRGPINKIVLHTMEAPCDVGWAKKCAEIAAVLDESRKVSAHFYVDPSAVWQGVHESDIAYAAPGANNDGIQIEQAGYAAFTTGDWSAAKQVAMEQVVAALIVDLSVRFDIPLRFCSAADMLADANAKGVTTHAEVNEAFHRSNHTDPGKNYPLDYVLIEARAILNPPVVIAQPPTPPPTPQESDDVPYLLISLAGYQNIVAAFSNGAIRQMPLSEYLFLRDVGKVPAVTETTDEGIDQILRTANMDHSELVPV